ncbi:uncharacterized protein LOC117654059 [Thrips palmi]|uniref:Uncharacterized protein LOC117654059 n=1 Tax=Thrips palmi TaxID=161013 RepID=A0A6P9AKS6_THRPL|nr:uncharacterized protein LOC117654059 [Thrips palmi]
MGTMGPLLACSAGPLGASAGSPEVLLQGYRSCLHEALRVLVEAEGAPTADPRVLALTAHLTRRQAALEMAEESRRQHQHLQQSQLLQHYFRGVDLHYSR